jgi:hypothetical protein
MVTSSAKATYTNRVRVGKALDEDDPKPEYPNVLNKLREKAEHDPYFTYLTLNIP